MIEPKKIAVLSGGGPKGAWQAAVLHSLIEHGHHYDGYCGSSAGAINAAFMAQFVPDAEFSGAMQLVKMWGKMEPSMVYKRHGFWGKMAALWKPSVYDSSPLRKTLETFIDPEAIRNSGKDLRLSAVSLENGSIWTWTEGSPDIVLGVQASAAFPGVLAPVRVEDELHTDGGVREHTPLSQAIRLGATQVDIIITSMESEVSPMKSKPNALDVAGQAINIMVDEIIRGDLLLASAYNRLVAAGLAPGKRHIDFRIIRPSKPLNVKGFDFSKDTISRLLEQGADDARRVV